MEYKREQRSKGLSELDRKVQKQQEVLHETEQKTIAQEKEITVLDKKIEHVRRRKIDIKNVEKIEPKYVSLSSKVILERTEYKNLSADAKKYAAQDKKEKKLQKLLDAANQMILKLEKKVVELTAELAEYRSVRGKLRIGGIAKGEWGTLGKDVQV